MPGELLLARIAAVRIEGVGLPRGCAEAAADRWIAVARVWPTQAGGFRTPLPTLIAISTGSPPSLRMPCGCLTLFSTVSLGPNRASITSSPKPRRRALQHQEVFDHLVGNTGGVCAAGSAPNSTRITSR
jgi:hypothetical protein